MLFPLPLKLLGLIVFALMRYNLCLSWPLNSISIRTQLNRRAKMQNGSEYPGNGYNQVETQKDKYKYQPPKFSDSFLEHLAQVKGSSCRSGNNEGVECEGEPALDPSRMVQDDGLDSEFLNEF